MVAPNPRCVGLCAGPDRVVIVGPSWIEDLAVHEIDLMLDGLERGERMIVLDEDGDPRLMWSVGSGWRPIRRSPPSDSFIARTLMLGSRSPGSCCSA